MDLQKLLIISAFCLLSLIKESGAIECYDCWTKDDDTCGYPSSLGEPGGCETRDNVCKKIVTKAYNIVKKGRDSYYDMVSNVTSRLCGKSHWTGCRTFYGSASETVECACDEDGCNLATSVTMATTSLVLSVMTGVLTAAHRLNVL